MNTREKIQRWLDENAVSQTDLARRAGIEPNKISQILNGSYGPTHTYIVPISRAMNASLDWLYDDQAGWPVVPRDRKGRFLSPGQEKLLELAARLSRKDDEPEALDSAIDRLLGVPGAEADLGAARAIGAKSRKEAMDGERPRQTKRGRGVG